MLVPIYHLAYIFADILSSILTVIPCNVDITTQEILKLAKAADPGGVRTMAVLTRLDLAIKEATKDGIIELVLGKRNMLKLGYHVVKNRSADDNISNKDDRLAAEKAFFMASPWSTIANHWGIMTLNFRLRKFLLQISQQEFPYTKSETEQRLHECTANLDRMGLSRADQSSQRLDLVKLASRFQGITQAALNGYCVGEKILTKGPDLKLVTKMTKLNEVFSNVIRKKDYKQDFVPNWDDEEKASLGNSIDDLPFEVSLAKYLELCKIVLANHYQYPESLEGPIISRVERISESNRGPEIGTASTFCCIQDHRSGSPLCSRILSRPLC